MLFDDEEQIEVRHVISLAHHNVSVYSGGDVTPEGELWIKRNALCLSRKQNSPELGPDSQVSKPFYLFSENCSAKEDFYFSLLKNKEQTFGASQDTAPEPKNFDVKHIISLVQKLHSSEENVHSRWVNALIGRMFLGIYRTADLEHFIREKLTKKIARVKRPSFLTNITIQKIDTGEAAPFFTNLKLRDLTVEGDCVVEADVKYTGNFRIEVAATAKIDLGPRFKAREVNLVLAVVAKKIEGHGLLKIKPPPSNRVWISFQTMPKMEMTIEPIVSSRQITYTVILRQIENRIKEIVAETLVLPFWDDIPFFKTEHKTWRGGVFEGDDVVDTASKSTEDILADSGDVDTIDRVEEKPELLAEMRPMEKSLSLPVMEKDSNATGIFGRKIKGTSGPSPAGSTTSFDTTKSAVNAGGPRSPQILNTTTEPVVGTDSAHADVFIPSTSPPDSATNYMAALHSRSNNDSPAATPMESPGKTPSVSSALAENYPSLSLTSEKGEEEASNEDDMTPVPPGRRNTASSVDASSIDDVPDSPISTKSASKYSTGSLGRNFWLRRENSNASTTTSSTGGDVHNASQKANQTLAAVSIAAQQARQWGWNAIQRQKEARKNSSSDVSNPQVDLSQPMGRGQPLPPPGTPLPMPRNGATKLAPIPVPKRKPVPGRQATDSSSTGDSGEEQTTGPSLPRRRGRGASHDSRDDQAEDSQGILVIAAPDDSEVETPAAEDRPEFNMTWDESTDANTLGGTDDEHSSKLASQTTQASTPPESIIHEEKTAAIESVSKPTRDSVPEPLPSSSTRLEKPVEDDDDYSGWLEEANTEEADVEINDKANGLQDRKPTPVAQEAK